MSLYSKIKYNLKEMSIEKRRLEDRIIDATDKINEHLLKCLVIQDKTHNLNHWSQEVYSFLPRVPQLRGSNKLPSKSLILKRTLGLYGTDLIRRMDIYIPDICRRENVEVPEYNKQSLYKCIENYYNWLASNLSETGEVLSTDVKAQINELIKDYNNSFTKAGV